MIAVDAPRFAQFLHSDPYGRPPAPDPNHMCRDETGLDDLIGQRERHLQKLIRVQISFFLQRAPPDHRMVNATYAARRGAFKTIFVFDLAVADLVEEGLHLSLQGGGLLVEFVCAGQHLTGGGTGRQ